METLRTYLFAAFAIFSYLLFLGSFGYFILFVGGIVVPTTVDTGPAVPIAEALLVNAGLLLLFGVQHSVMARRSFKRWWTRVVPSEIERSTYVMLASIIHVLIIWQWRPMHAVIWHVDHAVAESLLWGLFGAGWTTGITATFLISHFELFGLKQVWSRIRRKPFFPPDFKTPFLYRIVRHPMQAGIAVGLWATPHMTLGHLLLAGGMTVYILIGIHFEERDLVRTFGKRYLSYRRQVPKLVPRVRARRGNVNRAPSQAESGQIST